MTKQFVDAKEVSEALGVSQAKAYTVIRDLNAELKEKGYFTIAGKCSRKFFCEKFYGCEGVEV